MTCKKRYIFLFIIPAIFFYTLLVIFPFGYSFGLSFFRWSGVGEMRFVGLENFRSIFFGSFGAEFRNALGNSFYFFILNSFFELVVAFFIAVFLTSRIWGRRFFQTMVYLPNVISMVLVGFIWAMMLNPQWGLVNQLLRNVGLQNLTRVWLGEADTALTTIVMVNIWRNIGFYILVFVASILNVDPELMDAAYIDGASNWRVIRHILFPLVVPSFQTLLILIFIWSFNIFDIVYALGGIQGSPFRTTDVLGTLFYRTAFGGLGSSAQDYGLGAAIVVVVFLMVIPLSMVYAYLLEKRRGG